MTHSIFKVLLIAILTFCFSCLDEIDLEIPDGQADGLVIRGAIQKGTPSTVRVSINRIFNFNLSSLSPFNARSVTLFDEAGNSLVIPSTQDGVHNYTFTGGEPIEVDFGKQYSIRVVTFDGRTYESTPETLLPLPEKTGELSHELSSVTFLDEDGDERERAVAQILIDVPTELPNSDQKARLLWQAERTFRITDENADICYVSENVDFNRIHILDGSAVMSSVVEEVPLSRLPLNYTFNEGLYYTVYQRAITEGAFNYWNQTKQVIERTGSLFEAPAGRVTTNIFNVDNENDLTYGYFEAYAQDTLRLYIAPDEYEVSGICPAPRGQTGECALPLCCFCVLADGSTTTRPEFWVE